MYFCGLIGHQDITESLSLAYKGRKTRRVRQRDCHNYKGDLYAEREHGETVNLETELKVEWWDIVLTSETAHPLGQNCATAGHSSPQPSNCFTQPGYHTVCRMHNKCAIWFHDFMCSTVLVYMLDVYIDFVKCLILIFYFSLKSF